MHGRFSRVPIRVALAEAAGRVLLRKFQVLRVVDRDGREGVGPKRGNGEKVRFGA